MSGRSHAGGPGGSPTIAGLAAGAGVARALVRARVARPGRAPVRTNWRGRPVPVVLGEPVVAGGIAGLAAARVTAGTDHPAVDRATALLLVLTGAAGAWDDRMTDEPEKGFAGHLGALRSGRLTGGAVKLAAGGVAGLAAGKLVSGRREAVEIGACVALTANLVNLLDRAPGRAIKGALALAVAAAFGDDGGWKRAAAGTVGALLATLPDDLAERGMLGDAGANPTGAIAGLGLGLAFSGRSRLALLAALAGLNLASEKWSFSKVIERNAVLRALDRAGRSNATK